MSGQCHPIPRKTLSFAGWGLCLLALYVLSSGPVAMFAVKYHWPREPLMWIYAPLVLLHEHTPLKKPIGSYLEFWTDMAEKK